MSRPTIAVFTPLDSLWRSPIDGLLVTTAHDHGPQGATHCPVCGATILRHLAPTRNLDGDITGWVGTCEGQMLVVFL